MTLKDFLDFLQALAIPGLIGFIAINYRSEFKSLLNRLEKAKFGGAEISLSKEQAERAGVKFSQQAISLASESAESPIISSHVDSDSVSQEANRPFAVFTGDIDGDGMDELIISSIEGASWCRVRVFKPILKMGNDNEIETSFNLIDEISPVNFVEDVFDIDSDTYDEIIVNEDDQDSGQPHAAGFREKVIYKLISGQLSEISREKLPKLETQTE